mgnify:CR=1 FL=1
MGHILSIDFGKKRAGMAISDDSGKIALPLYTIEVEELDFAEKLQEIISERDIAKIVIGLPLNLSGDESPMSIFVRKFVRSIEYMGIETILWDERFTSVEARRAIHRMGKKPSLNKKMVDTIAATFILQSYLDAKESTNDESQNKT